MHPEYSAKVRKLPAYYVPSSNRQEHVAFPQPSQYPYGMTAPDTGRPKHAYFSQGGGEYPTPAYLDRPMSAQYPNRMTAPENDPPELVYFSQEDVEYPPAYFDRPVTQYPRKPVDTHSFPTMAQREVFRREVSTYGSSLSIDPARAAHDSQQSLGQSRIGTEVPRNTGKDLRLIYRDPLRSFAEKQSAMSGIRQCFQDGSLSRNQFYAIELTEIEENTSGYSRGQLRKEIHDWKKELDAWQKQILAKNLLDRHRKEYIGFRGLTEELQRRPGG